MGKTSQLGNKRKFVSKSITEIYNILIEVDEGNWCAFVAKKNTISQSKRYRKGLKRKDRSMNQLTQTHQQ